MVFKFNFSWTLLFPSWVVSCGKREKISSAPSSKHLRFIWTTKNFVNNQWHYIQVEYCLTNGNNVLTYEKTRPIQ